MAKIVAYIDKNTGEKEGLDSMLRRFKKKVLNEGILDECKKREYYVKPTVKRKLKDIEAAKRKKKNYK